MTSIALLLVLGAVSWILFSGVCALGLGALVARNRTAPVRPLVAPVLQRAEAHAA